MKFDVFITGYIKTKIFWDVMQCGASMYICMYVCVCVCVFIYIYISACKAPVLLNYTALQSG